MVERVAAVLHNLSNLSHTRSYYQHITYLCANSVDPREYDKQCVEHTQANASEALVEHLKRIEISNKYHKYTTRQSIVKLSVDISSLTSMHKKESDKNSNNSDNDNCSQLLSSIPRCIFVSFCKQIFQSARLCF